MSPTAPISTSGPHSGPYNDRLLPITIIRQLLQTADLDTFIHLICTAARELTDSEEVAVLLYEEDTQLLKFLAATGSKEKALKRVRVPLENSIAGQCFLQRRVFIVQNARQGERIFRDIERSFDYETQSLLAVPLIYQESTLGVLEAVNKRRNAHYTEEDATILEMFAGQTALRLQHALVKARLARVKQDIDELDRMKTNFIAIASHELRTPLGLILGHATDLKERLSDPQQKKQAAIIQSSALHLNKIIEDLENANLPQEVKPNTSYQSFSINRVVEEVLGAFDELARQKRIHLINDLPEKDLAVEGDVEKTEIALSNLVKNAITFTNENGHVLVSAEGLPGYVKVSVVDDGIGIPAKELNRVFERFYQVQGHMTREHGGLGLGLSIAKVMVEVQGGQIWVESVEGRGSNFSFLLPILAASPVQKTSPFSE